MFEPSSLTRRQILWSLGGIIARGWAVGAQDTSRTSRPTFSVDVEVVNVFVTVRDKKGRIVRDLAKEDFTLLEDGQIQVIQYFARETDLPLTIGLIVDTTPSEYNMLETERNASRIFLNHMLRPDKDKAFLIQFHYEVELLQDVTSSREKLEAALNLLQGHEVWRPTKTRGSRDRPGAPGQAPGFDNLSTVLADAIYLASEEIMKFQEGRKALIILGDGDHIGEREEMAITAAQKADTLIYTIRVYDKNFGASRGGRQSIGGIPPIGGPRGWPGGGWPGGRGPTGPAPGGAGDRADGKKNLQNLSRKTGGAYLEISKKETLEQIYSKIEEELRSQYSLGYTPDSKARDGYRRIEVRVSKSGMVVHSREGYYPRSKQSVAGI